MNRVARNFTTIHIKPYTNLIRICALFVEHSLPNFKCDVKHTKEINFFLHSEKRVINKIKRYELFVACCHNKQKTDATVKANSFKHEIVQIGNMVISILHV